jgi:hypothetical protein
VYSAVALYTGLYQTDVHKYVLTCGAVCINVLSRKMFLAFLPYTTHEDGTDHSEMSAHKIQTQQNHPNERIPQDEFSSGFLFL